MTKSELIKAVAEETGYSTAKVNHVVETMLYQMTDALITGDSVTLRGFGTLRPHHKAGNGSVTGDSLTVTFTKGDGFKRRIRRLQWQ